MSDKATVAASWMAILTVACGSESLMPAERLYDSPDGIVVQGGAPEEPPPTENDSCDDLEVLYSTCPELPFACPDEQTAACILEHASAFAGYCDMQSGAERCDGAEPSEAWADTCTIRACFGHDFDACLAEADCAPTVCDLIEVEAAHCPGYGYDCASHPEEESWCFLSVLLEYDDACFLFDDAELLCALGVPTCEGDASCKIQECFGLTSYDACYGNLEILCTWMP